MSDIFISYSKLDREIASRLAADLLWRGVNVWWDADLYAGQDYPAVILDVIDKSKVVIALWSPNAIKSDWVRDEANRAHQERKLIPTHIPPFSIKNVPLGLGSIQSTDVLDRKGLYAVIRRFGLQVHEPTIPNFPFELDPSTPLIDAVEQTRANLPAGLEENWSLVESTMDVLAAIDEDYPHYAQHTQTVRRPALRLFPQGVSAARHHHVAQFHDEARHQQRLQTNSPEFVRRADVQNRAEVLTHSAYHFRAPFWT